MVVRPTTVYMFLLKVRDGDNSPLIAMSTIKANIKSVRNVAVSDRVVYRVQLDKEFDGIVKQDDEYVEAKVDYFMLPRKVLIAQLCSLEERFGIIYENNVDKVAAGLAEPINAANIGVYFVGCEVTIERTKFSAGEEMTTDSGETITFEHDGYSTVIKDIKLSDKAEERLERSIDKLLL